jgi:hypothetical protein
MGKTDNSSPLADSQDSASALGVTSVGSGEISSSSGSPSTVVQAKAEAEDEYEYYSSDDQNNLKDVV